MEDTDIDTELYYYYAIPILVTGDIILVLLNLLTLLFLPYNNFIYVVTNRTVLILFFATMLVILVVCLILSYKTKHNPIYIKQQRTLRIKTQMTTVNNFIDKFTKEKKLLKDDYKISEQQRIEGISILDSYIVLLQDIYAELRISLSMAEMNYAVEQFKDIELSETNLESLSKQIDKMKAYRSLGEVSQELKDLLKKYDSGKIEKPSKK